MSNMLKKSLIYRSIEMKRSHKHCVMVFSDLLMLPLALWSGFALRLSEWWPIEYMIYSWWLFLVLPVVGVFVFMRLGLYRAVVRFMGAQAIWAVVKGVSLLALFLWAVAFIFEITPFPRSLPVSFALVALVYVGGSRLLVRYYYHWLLRYYTDKKSVLIYGAGGAGIQLATTLCDDQEYHPVGFVDDNSSLWKLTIKGLPVYGVSSLKEVIARDNVKHVLLALPNASNRDRKRVLESLSSYSVHIQTIPSMPDLLSGKASVEQLREVEIEDLLGRDSVPPMPELMAKCIMNKVVMITGAGGSIGSELCRQVLAQEPKVLILFEQSEYNLYKIEKELQNQYQTQHKNHTYIIALLGSVVDRERIKGIFSRFDVDTIYHAAAYKHVPLVESNVVVGIKNNIVGTQVLAEESSRSGVGHFILVSTDKAVRPTNIMGATKRFAELILQALSVQSKTVFSMVRFGNVLGSSGSVVPLFRKQIATGGPVTVTHKDITRFFMTIPEAASLVIQAGSMAKGGDVFVLDMGESVKIVDLAKRMIQLSGLELKTDDNPEGDIEICYTGLRPAEKLYEELLLSDDVVGAEHSKIMRAKEESLSLSVLYDYLSKISSACSSYDVEELKKLLCQSVSGYRPHEELVDSMIKLDYPNKNVVKLR